MMPAPRFAPEDFERLRNEAIDYVSKTLRGANDEELGKWTLQVELYRDHPYGHVDRGSVRGLKAIMIEDVKAFHKAHYTRGAIRIGIAGGAGKPFLTRVEGHLEPLPSGDSAPPKLPEPAVPHGLDVTIVEKP